MLRATILSVLALALAAACSPQPKKSGPAVAKGDGVLVTAGEFKARLDEQSPFIRQRYTTLERKKEFLDNLLRLELLARAAEKQGLDKDPDVLMTMKKVMVQKLLQKTFSEGDPMKEIPEADARKYYDDHRDEYFKPEKARLSILFVAAPASGPERAKKSAQAKKLLARVKAEEKKNLPTAFATVAREASEDAATKAAGGDIGMKGKDEMEKAYGKEFAGSAFALEQGALAVLEGPQGFWVVKATGRQPALERSFEQVRGQIASRLYRERRTKDFEEYVKRLREEAHVTVNDAELEKVAVAPANAGGAAAMPGMPGMPHGGGPGPGAVPFTPPAAPPASGTPGPSAARPVPPPAQK
jgi:peptidyl-prolyl cis-trans isomerase C